MDWATKLSLTVGGSAGRLGSTSGWGDGELQMCAYHSYARGDRRCSLGLRLRRWLTNPGSTLTPNAESWLTATSSSLTTASAPI